MKRVFLIVLDSYGCGEMPDAKDFGRIDRLSLRLPRRHLCAKLSEGLDHPHVRPLNVLCGAAALGRIGGGAAAASSRANS